MLFSKSSSCKHSIYTLGTKEGFSTHTECPTDGFYCPSKAGKCTEKILKFDPEKQLRTRGEQRAKLTELGEQSALCGCVSPRTPPGPPSSESTCTCPALSVPISAGGSAGAILIKGL